MILIGTFKIRKELAIFLISTLMDIDIKFLSIKASLALKSISIKIFSITAIHTIFSLYIIEWKALSCIRHFFQFQSQLYDIIWRLFIGDPLIIKEIRIFGRFGRASIVLGFEILTNFATECFQEKVGRTFWALDTLFWILVWLLFWAFLNRSLTF